MTSNLDMEIVVLESVLANAKDRYEFEAGLMQAVKLLKESAGYISEERSEHRHSLAYAAKEREAADRQREALRQIQQRAWSESMGEELEDAQADLRAIHELASRALEEATK